MRLGWREEARGPCEILINPPCPATPMFRLDIAINYVQELELSLSIIYYMDGLVRYSKVHFVEK